MDTPKNNAPLRNVHPALYILITLFIVFITYQLFGGMLLLAFTGIDLDAESLKNKDLSLVRIIMAFSQFMFILAPVLLLNYLKGNDLKETFRLKKPEIMPFILSLAGIIVIQPFLQVYMYFQNKFIFSLPFSEDLLKPLKELFDQLENTTAILVSASSLPEFLVVAFVIALTPAICEEIMFRGSIFSSLDSFIPARKALFFTGLLFAFFHFHPFNLVPLILLGFYLTFVMYYSKSIYTAMACHFVNNFIAAYAVYMFGAESFSVSPNIVDGEILTYIIYGLLSAGGFISLIYLIRKTSSISKKEIEINYKDASAESNVVNTSDTDNPI